MRPLREFVRSLRLRFWGPAAHCLDTCLILPKQRILYAYVPKSACTSIKTWLLRHSGECPDIAAQFDRADESGNKPPDAHDTMAAQFHAKRLSARVVRAALYDDGWFRFTVVRHPLRRLVSAYLDKVVNAKSTAHALIAAGQAALGYPSTTDRYPTIDTQRSLSFREFVRALHGADQETVDVHFRAQARLLRGLKFDHVGKIENLPADFAAVQRALGIEAPLAWKHVREYSIPVLECVADWPAERFRNVAVPPWQAFYDEVLRQSVSELYAADFERFGYEPKLTVQLAA